ncbi:hypothetical protein N657DRAFT_637415 [Parathielavia appendiculata]|uniref:Uncharacterized protein n=1 Tax=Parathielavia appendiculata TaxID=2587402 RepID=A0AAN6TS12_9PEZI|nr:hypothetical protein N657DRAFT_637415 [Parathielavia appendiculata]
MPSRNSRRGIHPPVSPVQPPSSVYSQQSQPSIPVSLPSSASGKNAGAGTYAQCPSMIGPSRPRPSSSAFFHGMAVSPAPGYGGLGGYDGTYDHHLPPSPAPSQMPFPIQQPRGFFPNATNGAAAAIDHDNNNNNGNNNNLRTKTEADKPKSKASITFKTKTKTKSITGTKNQVLKVNPSTLSTNAKVGIFLMGTTPKKLEKAALALQVRRRWERAEKKRARRERKRGAGAGDGRSGHEEGQEADGGYGDDEWEVEEGGEWQGKEEW